MATMVPGLTLVSVYSSSSVFFALVVRGKGRGLGLFTGTVRAVSLLSERKSERVCPRPRLGLEAASLIWELGKERFR